MKDVIIAYGTIISVTIAIRRDGITSVDIEEGVDLGLTESDFDCARDAVQRVWKDYENQDATD